MARQNMGISQVGFNKSLIKRKFRYLFEIERIISLSEDTMGTSNYSWACQANRPTYQFEMTEVKHVYETVFYPVRLKWEPVQITLIDVHRANGIYKWLNAMYDPRNPIMNFFDTPDEAIDYPKHRSRITMFNGIGEKLEVWELEGCFPEQVQWGDLDYTSNEFAQITVTIRFDRAYIAEFGEQTKGGQGTSINATVNSNTSTEFETT